MCQDGGVLEVFLMDLWRIGAVSDSCNDFNDEKENLINMIENFSNFDSRELLLYTAKPC